MNVPALLTTLSTTVAGTHPGNLETSTKVAVEALDAVYEVCDRATRSGPPSMFAATLLAGGLAAQALLVLGYPPIQADSVDTEPVDEADLDAAAELAVVTACLLRQADERHRATAGPLLGGAAGLADEICQLLARS